MTLDGLGSSLKLKRIAMEIFNEGHPKYTDAAAADLGTDSDQSSEYVRRYSKGTDDFHHSFTTGAISCLILAIISFIFGSANCFRPILDTLVTNPDKP